MSDVPAGAAQPDALGAERVEEMLRAAQAEVGAMPATGVVSERWITSAYAPDVVSLAASHELLRARLETAADIPVWCQGAVGMAQHWLRNPELIVDAGFPQVARELYTISRGLAFLAARAGVEAAQDSWQRPIVEEAEAELSALLAAVAAAEQERDELQTSLTREVAGSMSWSKRAHEAVARADRLETALEHASAVIEAARGLDRRMTEIDGRADDFGRTWEQGAFQDAITAYDAALASPAPDRTEAG